MLVNEIVSVLHALGVDAGADTPMMERGLDSTLAAEFASALEAKAATAVPATLAFECSTPRDIAQWMAPERVPKGHRQTAIPSKEWSRAPPRISQCICKVGGGGDVWTMAQAGGDAVAGVPSLRWSTEWTPPTPAAEQCARHGAYISSAHRFDASMFSLSLAEASAMDPQQRMVLEMAYQSMHGAGHRRASTLGSEVGHFLGITRSDWFRVRISDSARAASAFDISGDTCAVACGRVSYALGWQGPCMSVDTACSSSLSAWHVAARTSHADGNAAVVAGIRLELAPQHTYDACAAGMLSLTGKCHTLDARADGYVSSEGACAALVDGHTDKGDTTVTSLVHHDGRSASLTAPNGAAQAKMISEAHESDEEVRRLSIELHGTGTRLGDPTETTALGKALTAKLAWAHAPGKLGITGVKANSGHGMASSGMVGLLKRVEEADVVHPNRHLRMVNPLVATGCHLVGTQTMAPASSKGRGGVSSFGYSGTIAHMTTTTVTTRAEGRKKQTASRRLTWRRVSMAWTKPGPRSKSVARVTSDALFDVDWSSARVRHDPTRLLSSRRCVTVLSSRADETRHLGCDGANAVVMVVAEAAAEGVAPDLAALWRLTGVLTVLGGTSNEEARVFLVIPGIVHCDAKLAPPRAAWVGACGGATGMVAAIRRELAPSLQHVSTADAQSAEWTANVWSRVLTDSAPDAREPCVAACAREGMWAAPRLRWVAKVDGLVLCRPRRRTTTEREEEESVITGGLGGLGLRACTVLQRVLFPPSSRGMQASPAVHLVSRSGRVAREGQGLSSMLQSALARGARVVPGCDVGVQEDVAASAPTWMAHVRRVLHFAGVTHNRPAARLRPQDLHVAFAPKACGAAYLHACLFARPLASFVHSSSVSTFWGREGQACYGAANSYLESFAAIVQRARGMAGQAWSLPGVAQIGMGAALEVSRAFVLSLPQFDTVVAHLLAGTSAVCSSSTTVSMPSSGHADVRNPLFDNIARGARSEPTPARVGGVACVCVHTWDDVRDARSAAPTATPLVVVRRVGGECGQGGDAAEEGARMLARRAAPWMLVLMSGDEEESKGTKVEEQDDALTCILKTGASVCVRVGKGDDKDEVCFEEAGEALAYVTTVAQRWSQPAAARVLVACRQRLPAPNLSSAVAAMGWLYPKPPRGIPHRLVKLLCDRRVGVAVVELNDPARSNTLSRELAEDVACAAEKLRDWAYDADDDAPLRAVVVRGAGAHFCVGVNPYRHADAASPPYPASVEGCDAMLRGFLRLRELGVPIVAAVHGKLIGAALAASLNADAVVADADSTFQHGNLVRGVCPLGELSRTLPRRIGWKRTLEMYLTDDVWTSASALEAGLIDKVETGVDAAWEAANALAVEWATTPSLAKEVVDRRVPIDWAHVGDESVGHADALVANGGRYKSSPIPTRHEVPDEAVRRAVPLVVPPLPPSSSPPLSNPRVVECEVPSILTEAVIDSMLRDWPLDDASATLVLRGEKADTFCLGGDPTPSRLESGDFVRDVRAFATLHSALTRAQCRVVAACSGATRGFGMVFPLAADQVVATKEATFAFPEVRRGVLPGVVSVTAASKLAPSACERLFASADVMHADEAKALGLVDVVVDEGEAAGWEVRHAESMPGGKRAGGSKAWLSAPKDGCRGGGGDALVVVSMKGMEEAEQALKDGRVRPRVLILEVGDASPASCASLQREAAKAGVVLIASARNWGAWADEVHWVEAGDDNDKGEEEEDEAMRRAERFAAWLLAQPEEGMRHMIQLTGGQ